MRIDRLVVNRDETFKVRGFCFESGFEFLLSFSIFHQSVKRKASWEVKIEIREEKLVVSWLILNYFPCIWNESIIKI